MGELKDNRRPLGASGTDVVGKIHNADDHIESLTGFEAALFYDRMRRSDTQVRKVLSAINNPIKSAQWEIEPASDETKDVESAALIKQILFKDISWSKFLNEALTCVMHGFSIFEVVHENKENVDIGMYTGLAQLGYRKQSTITEWCHNPVTGVLERVKQESFGDIAVSTFMPADTLLIFYNDQEGDNIGFPLGRILFGPYKRKLIATELQYIGIERFAIPTPILKTPKNLSQSDAEYIAAVDVLKNFTSAEDSFITYPDGWELILHNNVFDPAKLQVVIQAENENMSGAILASFLELGIGGNGGAFALSNDLSDFFLAGLEYFANIIKDKINTILIPNLMALNFGDQVLTPPQLVSSGISDKAGKELMEIVTGYASGGVITVDEALEDHVRKVHHLPAKVEGTMLENQEASNGDGSEGNDDTNDSDNDIDDSDDDNTPNVVLKLADVVGHRHTFKGQTTGPAIEKGQKHFHQLLDSDGNPIGKTGDEKIGLGHTHTVGLEKTSAPIVIKLADEPKENPRKMILDAENKLANIIRTNLDIISSKYIADVMNKYKQLSDKRKQNAIKDVKVGGINKFKKELKAALTSLANDSLTAVRKEIPDKSNVKLSDKIDSSVNFKFNDFSKLPKEIQLLIANQADLISFDQANDITNTVAFQFTSSQPSTEDINILRKDLQDSADKTIQSGNRDRVAANASATVVNESRNAFLLDDDVQESIASYTFINFSPKSDICKALAGKTFAVNDGEIVRFNPPLHHNCKSYVRANLKTSKNVPDITGLPPLSDAAKKSITLREGN